MPRDNMDTDTMDSHTNSGVSVVELLRTVTLNRFYKRCNGNVLYFTIVSSLMFVILMGCSSSDKRQGQDITSTTHREMNANGGKIEQESIIINIKCEKSIFKVGAEIPVEYSIGNVSDNEIEIPVSMTQVAITKIGSKTMVDSLTENRWLLGILWVHSVTGWGGDSVKLPKIIKLGPGRAYKGTYVIKKTLPPGRLEVRADFDNTDFWSELDNMELSQTDKEKALESFWTGRISSKTFCEIRAGGAPAKEARRNP